jgi:hypothetical protein
METIFGHLKKVALEPPNQKVKSFSLKVVCWWKVVAEKTSWIDWEIKVKRGKVHPPFHDALAHSL